MRNLPPLVSVICLSFNHEKFIEKTLISVIAQTYENLEIIFIDNNSVDGSFEKGQTILSESGRKYIAIKSERNLGVSGGLNWAIQNSSKGKYFAPLSCDDFWDIYNLEEKVSYLEKYADYCMVYSNGYIFNDSTFAMQLYYKSPSFSGDIFLKLLSGLSINPVGILYRTKVAEYFNFFDEKANIEDRDLWFKIAKNNAIGYIHTPLTFYRIHGSNASANIEYMRKGNEYLSKKYEEEYPKEIQIARRKQEIFFAYTLSQSSPTFQTFLKLLINYHPNWPYTKELIRSFYLIFKH